MEKASAGVTETVEIWSVCEPPLVRTTTRVSAVPTACAPKERLVGEKVSARAPEPESETVCGLPEALSVNVSVAVYV